MSILGLQTHTEIAMSMDVFIKPQTKVPGYLADLLQPLQTGGKTQDTEECLFLLLHFLNDMVRGGTPCGAVWACNKQCSIEIWVYSNVITEGEPWHLLGALLCPSFLQTLNTHFGMCIPPAECSWSAHRGCQDHDIFFCFKHFCTSVVFEDMVDSCVQRHGHEVWGFLKLLM